MLVGCHPTGRDDLERCEFMNSVKARGNSGCELATVGYRTKLLSPAPCFSGCLDSHLSKRMMMPLLKGQGIHPRTTTHVDFGFRSLAGSVSEMASFLGKTRTRNAKTRVQALNNAAINLKLQGIWKVQSICFKPKECLINSGHEQFRYGRSI